MPFRHTLAQFFSAFFLLVCPPLLEAAAFFSFSHHAFLSPGIHCLLFSIFLSCLPLSLFLSFCLRLLFLGVVLPRFLFYFAVSFSRKLSEKLLFFLGRIPRKFSGANCSILAFVFGRCFLVLFCLCFVLLCVFFCPETVRKILVLSGLGFDSFQHVFVSSPTLLLPLPFPLLDQAGFWGWGLLCSASCCLLAELP